MMQARCSICSDLFDLRHDISATVCGHIFHATCLSLWLRQSKSCPQCRLKLKEKNLINKLYFDVDESDGGNDENSECRNQLEDLKVEMISLKREKNEMKERNVELEENIRMIQVEKESLQTALFESRNSNKILKQELKQMDKVRCESHDTKVELNSLKKKISSLNHLQIVLDNATVDVNELMTKFGQMPKVEDVLLWHSIVRKELIKSDEMMKKLKEEINAIKKEKKKIESKLKANNEKLDETEKDLKYAQGEIENQKKRLELLGKEVSETTTKGSAKKNAIKRILSESPLPENFIPKLTPESKSQEWIPLSPEYTPSPEIINPPIKIRRFGVPLKSNIQLTGNHNRHFSQTCTSQSFQYDGLGGRSKWDSFPVLQKRDQKKRC